MAINLADELNAATVKGKIASAKQVYLEGDTKNLQQLGEETQQLKNTINDISVTGGASTANAVSYDNSTSGMAAVNAQGALDELRELVSEQAQIVISSVASLTAKDNEQDTEIAKKADSSDVNSQMQTEQTRVNAELDKKFDKENVAQELGDSEDKVVSQYALPFRIEESPEWAYLIKDAEDHVLFGIQQDGSVEWQVGIPTPIRKRFEEIVSSASDDKSDLSTKIDELNTSLSAEIQSLQDTKVDKEEGKSLIDDEVKQHFEVIENDEWLTLMTDAEDHILFGIKRDTGKPYFPLNEMYHVEQSPEFFALWKDAEDHILMGIRRDGEIVGEIHAVNALKQTIADIQSNINTLQSDVTSATDKINTVEKNISTIDASLQELLSVISLQENPEFLAVETDAEGKMLAYTKNDGSHYAYNMKSETIPEEFSHIEDPEGRMAIETDAEQKILAYRDKEGVKHEHEADVNTLHVSNLNLKDNSVNDIQSALIANGFNVKTPIDWSESSSIQIPEPNLGIINITNIKSMPTTKTDNLHAYLEFRDRQGNYFKKKVILNAQGANSLTAPKKNFAIDFCEDDWVGDSTTTIKFGKWVPQDGFHCKAFFGDLFRGLCVVCYKYMDRISKTRGFEKDRAWKKALIDYESINSYESGIDSPLSKMDLMFDTGARCVPDGFPCLVYLNDSFYGIFSFQLKKHRDNYHMDKKKAEHIHIDPDYIDSKNFFNGVIDWSNFEIRNPKQDSNKNKLLAIYTPTILSALPSADNYAPGDSVAIANNDGTHHVYLLTFAHKWKDLGNILLSGSVESGYSFDYDYNGDYPRELSVSNDISKKVKTYIQNFSNAIPEIKKAENIYLSSSKGEEDLKSLKDAIEAHFDVDTLIDYLICSDVVNNWDGFRRNWQWLTYDGKKWFVSMYDCDNTFGSLSTQVVSPFTSFLGNNTSLPSGWIHKYYQDELNERYKYLSEVGLISVDTLFNIVLDWVDRIGENNFALEYEKWSNSYCFNKTSVNNEYWELVTDSQGHAIKGDSLTYSKETTYTVGETCYYGVSFTNGNYYQFKCVKECTNEVPATFRYIDNIYRLYKWINENINNMDKLYSYSRKI